MAITSDGTRDQPQVASSGNTPDFAADLTAVSDFFAVRSLRRFTTVALLLASSGSNTDDYAIATNAPGAMFRNTGSGWKMYGVPEFADSSARATAISAPVVGMRSRLLDTGRDYVYSGSAWLSTPRLPHEEFSAVSASIASGSTSSIGTPTREAAESNATLASISSNTLTITEDGLYDLTWNATLAAAPTGAFFIRVSDGTNLWQASGVTVSGSISMSIAGMRFAAGTVLTYTFYHVSSTSRVLTTARIALTRIGSY